jgi:hypothetical protein
LVEKLLKTEIESKISVQEDDLKNYFKANKEKFMRKSSLRVTVLEYKGKKLREKIQTHIRKKQTLENIQKKFPGLSSEEKVVVKSRPFQNLSENERKSLFKKSVGSWAGPFLKGGVYKTILIKEKRPSEDFPFEKIRSFVEQSYKMEKGQNLYKELVKESFKTEDVQLFVERWK